MEAAVVGDVLVEVVGAQEILVGAGKGAGQTLRVGEAAAVVDDDDFGLGRLTQAGEDVADLQALVVALDDEGDERMLYVALGLPCGIGASALLGQARALEQRQTQAVQL